MVLSATMGITEGEVVQDVLLFFVECLNVSRTFGSSAGLQIGRPEQNKNVHSQIIAFFVK